MRKLFLALPLLLLGCGEAASDEGMSRAAQARTDAVQVLSYSTVVCADGNQVRMAVYAFGGQATAFSGWTILNDDGTPKKCVKRPKAIQPQYEEVPQ